MADRQRVGSGTIWEDRFGYSRALRVGKLIFVAGTTATADDGQLVGENDPEAQARFIFAKIERALQAVGGSMADVVRTRSFLTNANDWEAVGRAHVDYFGAIRPVSTVVEVSALIGPEYLVEIEVDAVLGDNQ